MFQVLDMLRFDSLVYYTVDLVTPWNIMVPGRDATIRFHFIKKGRCYIFDEQTDSYEVGNKGDLIFISSEGDHYLRSEPRKKPNQEPDTEFCFSNFRNLKNSSRKKTDASVLCGQIKPENATAKELLANFPAMVLLKEKDMSGIQKSLCDFLIEDSLNSVLSEAVISRIAEILVISILHKQSTKSPLNKKYDEVFRYLQSNYATAIDWNGFLGELGVSRPVFFNRFKELTGMTPNEYLNSVRMKKAMVLLQGSDTPIKVIALEVGFQTIASFSKKFKDMYGIAPSEFRKRR